MKKSSKILAGVVGGIVFLLVVFYIVSYDNEAEIADNENGGVEVAEVATTTNPFTLPEPGDQLDGARFNVPGGAGEIKLKKGVVDFATAGNSSGTVAYLSANTIEIETDIQAYLAAPVAVDSGGTGNFLYLVLYEKTATGFNQLNDVLLGDRVVLLSLVVDESYNNPRVLATILERELDEPLAAEPTVEKVLTFELADGELVSIPTPYGQ